MKATLLIIDQHRHHAEEIYRDVHALFDHYHIAMTVQEARLLIGEHYFDMVILDPFFGDGNGRLFIRELKNNADLCCTPIIVVSDLPASRAKLDFYSYGADSYIEKPYDKAWFFKAIAQEMEQHFKLLADRGKDKRTGFLSRDEFELDFIESQRKLRELGETGVLGLIAPAGIDYVIRDYGLETGNKLMIVISELMRKMCSGKQIAAFWTQKSIAFLVMNQSRENVKAALGKLKDEFLQNFKEIVKLQKTPGLRAVLTPMTSEMSLHTSIEMLSNHLVLISRNLQADPIQFYGDNVTLKRQVMIADPDPVALAVIKHHLRKDGFETNTFQEAEELEHYPMKHDIAAILVDSMIPGGGIDLVRKISAKSELDDIPIMLLSRYGYEDEIANAFQAGAQDYMMKPLSMVELSARMKRLTG